MKILVLNGSPKGEQSDTMHITNSLVEGLNHNNSNEIEIIHISKKNVNPCLGCFACWHVTPGKCAQNDDMQEIFQKYIAADMVIWSFPLYYFGMPSGIKAVMDRLLPANSPEMEINESGHTNHPTRHEGLWSKKIVVVCGSGFPDFERNFDAVKKQFSIIYANTATMICVPESPMFNVSMARPVTIPYLKVIKQAGIELNDNGSICEATVTKINTPMIPQSEYVRICNGK